VGLVGLMVVKDKREGGERGAKLLAVPRQCHRPLSTIEFAFLCSLTSKRSQMVMRCVCQCQYSAPHSKGKSPDNQISPSDLRAPIIR
jgi:hypothetical protein